MVKAKPLCIQRKESLSRYTVYFGTLLSALVRFQKQISHGAILRNNLIWPIQSSMKHWKSGSSAGPGNLHRISWFLDSEKTEYLNDKNYSGVDNLRHCADFSIKGSCQTGISDTNGQETKKDFGTFKNHQLTLEQSNGPKNSDVFITTTLQFLVQILGQMCDFPQTKQRLSLIPVIKKICPTLGILLEML